MQKRGSTTTTPSGTTAGKAIGKVGRWWGRRGRILAGASGRSPGRAYHHQVIEPLEQRQLLTTLTGGGPGQLASYLFATDGSAVPNARINIYGDVTAEFIFMHGATQEIVSRDLNGGGGGGGSLGLNIFSDSTTPTGSNIFAIYVSKADINSYISIHAIDTTTLVETPFGSSQSFDIFPDNPRGTATAVTAPAGGGSLLLGASTGGTFDAAIIKADINGAGMGVRPAGLDDLPDDPTNDLSAGLRVANGQDLGKFLFDGEIFGQVRVDGSMNMFYAGWILTGDARGAVEGGATTSGYPVSQVDNFITQSDINAGEATGHLVPRQNFYIGGDLQTLATVGALGWDTTFGTGGPLAPFYLTGTDIYVRGRLGNVQSNLGSAATITAANVDPAVAGFTRHAAVQTELESLNAPTGSGIAGDSSVGFPNTPSSNFAGGLPYEPGTTPIVPFRNDTFDSFQFLGTFTSDRGNDIIDVVGNLNTNVPTSVHDPNDYYGISLLAGQTVRVQLISLFNNYAHVGVFDPDHRLIATDYTNVNTPNSGGVATNTYSYDLPFQFTADRPGIYRFAIGGLTDPDFAGAATRLLPDYYRLIVTNVGAMAIGGVRIGNDPAGQVADGSQQIIDVNNVPPVVQSLNGDVGGIYASGRMYVVSLRDLFRPQSPTPPNSISQHVQYGSFKVVGGDLRAFDFTSLGITNTGRTGPDLTVPNGSVGLVQARSPGGILELNPSLPLNFSPAGPVVQPPNTPTSPIPLTLNEVAIGGNYQVINAAGLFMGGVVARKGMGILRANAINGPSGDQPIISLDADNSGFDGKSDLIDIATDILIGPALYHGPGGNFRYFRVGGSVAIDPQFGSSNIGYVPHNYGEAVSFTDDSGSSINLTPLGQRIANPAWTPLDPTQGPQFFLPQLTTLAYPVRSGGVIVMDVQSTGSIAIQSDGGSFNSTAEISRVEVHGNGTAPVATTAFTKRGYRTTLALPFNSPVLGTSLSVDISGSAVTDVAYIVGMLPEVDFNFYNNGPGASTQLGNLVPPFRSLQTGFSDITSISNSTGGEILSVNARNLGNIYSHGTLGITRTTSIAGNSLNFIAPITVGTAYAARSGAAADNAPVNPTGDAVGSTFPFNQQTYGIAVGGHIVSARADRGLGNIISQGIIGSVVANADGKNVGSEIEGINAPVMATSALSVINPNTQAGVGNGSILSVGIGEGMGSAGSGDFARTGIFADGYVGTITGSNADIRGDIEFGTMLESINLDNGSLIDANILHVFNVSPAIRESAGGATNISINASGILPALGSITLSGKGGIIGSYINAATIGPVRVDGFGIISSLITTNFSGAGITSLTVAGYGIRDSVISTGNDLKIVNVTGNGSSLSTRNVTSSIRQSEHVRADPQLAFGFDPYSGRALTPLNDIHSALGTSQATPNIKGVTDTGVIEDTRIDSQRNLGTIRAQVIRGPYTRFTAGNAIDTIETRGLINGLFVIAGRINKFLPGSDVMALHMTISGPLSNLTIKGTLGKNSVVEAIGPNGRIGSVNIKRDLIGTIHAVQTIDTVTVGRNLKGSLKVDALNRGGLALKKLHVGGTMSNGSLDVGAIGNSASVGEIIIGGSLGGSANDKLNVRGKIDRLQVGKKLKMSVNAGRIGTLQAGAGITGPVKVGGMLSNLLVKKGGLRGNVTAGGKILNAQIAGGLAANVTATNGIGSFVVNGNVAPGYTIRTSFGAINTVRVNHGSLFGSVVAGGKIGKIIVARDFGNGTAPATISGGRLGLLQIGGSIRDNASVHIRGPIDSLIVGGDIEDGAVVQAKALKKQKIGGQVFGTLQIG